MNVSVPLLLCIPVAYFACLLILGLWMQRKHGNGLLKK